MPKYSDFSGVIFDVDDTLLDNLPRDPVRRLHERSRLQAIHTVGKRHGIKELRRVTAQQNIDGFLTAPAHSLRSAVWNIMYIAGLVAVNEPDDTNQIFQEIVNLKDQLHEKLLREEGNEVPGASAFVRSLAANGFKDKMAIGSTAVPRDINIFLEKTGLTPFFPKERIISLENITHPKPHPEVFELAFKTLGLKDKTKVLVFEDDPRGIMAAKAAGLQVYAITTAYDRGHLAAQPVAPDLIADSFAEFRQLLGLPAE